MSAILRGLLVLVSLFFFAYIVRKIRKAQLQIEYAIFWVGFSLLLIIMSLFPNAVYSLTKLFGMQAPVNFVFLMIIFILLLRTFAMSLKLAQLEEKIKNLVQQVAIRNNELEKNIEAIRENEKRENE